MESFIIANRLTLKNVELDWYSDWDREKEEKMDEDYDRKRYLQSVLEGLMTSVQQDRDSLALEQLELKNDFQLDEHVLTKLLWLAPTNFELDGPTLSVKETESCIMGAMNWSSCRLQNFSLGMSCYDVTQEVFVWLLNCLAQITSLKQVHLWPGFSDGGFESCGFDAAKGTDPLIAMMAANENLECLSIGDCFLPNKDKLCKQLAKSKTLKSLDLQAVNGERKHNVYFKALAGVLKENPLLPLECFQFEHWGYDLPEWGPHDINYFTTLNWAGRQQMIRGESFNAASLVMKLSRFCGQSAVKNLAARGAALVESIKSAFPETQEEEEEEEAMEASEEEEDKEEHDDNDDNDDNEDDEDEEEDEEGEEEGEEEEARTTTDDSLVPEDNREAAFEKARESLGLSHRQAKLMQTFAMFTPDPWANSEEEQQLKDACVLYGLLRESPGVWSQMALGDPSLTKASGIESKRPGKRKPSMGHEKEGKMPRAG